MGSTKRRPVKAVPSTAQLANTPRSSSAFVLAQELDALTYDFRTDNNPDASHGTIPEPSTTRVEGFKRTVQEVMLLAFGQVEEDQPTTTAGIVALLSDTEKSAERKDAENKLRQALADLCGGSPNADDIAALPYRAQQAFSGWLIGVFLRPEA